MTDSSTDSSTEPLPRCGYVALIGRPNVGKSTLMNALVGEKLSIVTHKAQTTRQRILGIQQVEQGQIIYLDTPGLHRAAHRALNRQMNRIAEASLLDADVALFVVEALQWTEDDERVLQALNRADKPVLLVINKVDRVQEKEALLPYVEERQDGGDFEEVLLVSALKQNGLDGLVSAVVEQLPFTAPLFCEDEITDRSERFLAAEYIREQLTLRLHEELPYQLTVEVESFKREKDILHIHGLIWVERNSQKAIVIGKGGRQLKAVGQAVRRELEQFFGQQVMLKLWVKVADGWSDSERQLQRLGLMEPRDS